MKKEQKQAKKQHQQKNQLDEQQHLIPTTNKPHSSPQAYLHNLVIFFLFFGSGLIIGITLISLPKDLPPNIQLKQFNDEYAKPPQPHHPEPHQPNADANSNSNANANAPEPHEPEAAEEPKVEIAADKPIVAEEPKAEIAADKPIVAEEPKVEMAAEEPKVEIAAEKPIVAGEPIVAEEPKVEIATEKPIVAEEPKVEMVAEEPKVEMVAEEPKVDIAAEKPIVAEEPKVEIAAEKPIVAEEPKAEIAAEKPIAAEEPKVEMVAEEPKVEIATEKPIVAEEPKAEIAAEKPIAAEEPKVEMVAEEPKVEMVAEEPKVEIAAEKQIVAEEPKVEIAAEKQIVAEEPKVEIVAEVPKVETLASLVGGNGLNEYLKAPDNSHNMTEEELLWKASTMPKRSNYPSNLVPKVAFMFLAKRELPMAPIWEMFFRGHQGLYSIYIHSQPSYDGSDIPEDSVFHGRLIPSQKVEWGKFNMVEAERRLLANALLDFANQRFVLLSEACIPLFNFTTVYNYLIESTTSFVESYDQAGPVGRGRYNKRMKPYVKLSQWRKGSQWFEMDRELAIEVVSDKVYSSVFRKHCKPSCYSDEHYLPTFVTKKFPWKNANRTLTWVDWSHGGPHPFKFIRYDISTEMLERLRHGTECVYNGRKTNVCYMFARKFSLHALDRLIRFAPSVIGF